MRIGRTMARAENERGRKERKQGGEKGPWRQGNESFKMSMVHK